MQICFSMNDYLVTKMRMHLIRIAFDLALRSIEYLVDWNDYYFLCYHDLTQLEETKNLSEISPVSLVPVGHSYVQFMKCLTS